MNCFCPIGHSSLEGLPKDVRFPDFKIVRKICEGKKTQVFEVIHRSSRATYALKKTEQRESPNPKRQAELLLGCEHPNVLLMHRFFEDEEFCYFLQELGGEDLLAHLNAHKGNYREGEMHQLFHQMVLGVRYLHQKGIAHRDIKLNNFIFVNGILKIIDFDFVKKIEESGRHTPCGAPACIAPEIVLHKPYDKGVDHFSLGIALYMLAYKIKPFGTGKQRKIFRKMVAREPIVIPDEPAYSQEFKDLIRGLIEKNPEHRLGKEECCEEILRHPWMQKDHSQPSESKQENE